MQMQKRFSGLLWDNGTRVQLNVWSSLFYGTECLFLPVTNGVKSLSNIFLLWGAVKRSWTRVHFFTVDGGRAVDGLVDADSLGDPDKVDGLGVDPEDASAWV